VKHYGLLLSKIVVFYVDFSYVCYDTCINEEAELHIIIYYLPSNCAYWLYKSRAHNPTDNNNTETTNDITDSEDDDDQDKDINSN